MISLSVSFFFLFATMAVMGPHLQLFLRAKGFGLSQVGLLLGCFQLAGVAGPLLLGHLTDRWGTYRAILFATVAGAILSFVALQLAEGLIPAIFFIAFLGIFFRAPISLMDAHAIRALPNPVKDYGKVRVVGTMGFIVTLLLFQVSGLMNLDSSLSILIAYVVAASLFAGSIIALPSGTAAGAGAGERAKLRGNFDGDFWLVIVILFLGRLGISSYYAFFSIYLKESLGIANVGGIWAVSAVSEVPIIFFSGFIILRFSVASMLKSAMAAIIVRLLLYALVPSLGAIIPSQLLHAFTLGIFHIAAITYIREKIDPAKRALGMAIYLSFGIGLPGFFGGLIGGVLLEAFNFRTLFLLFIIPAFASLMLLVPAGKRLGAPDRSREEEHA
jgi:PPP family 3-phenylpropionic acid transporter